MCHNFKTIKVGDFGISKRLEHTTQELSTINAHGFPAYVAIELYNDNKFTTSADIWSLGCILYEMVHRRRFFAPDFVAWHPAINWENTKKKVRDYQHQQIKETCPPKIKQLILKCVSFKPQDRPTAFAALNEATDFAFNLDTDENIESTILSLLFSMMSRLIFSILRFTIFGTVTIMTWTISTFSESRLVFI